MLISAERKKKSKVTWFGLWNKASVCVSVRVYVVAHHWERDYERIWPDVDCSRDDVEGWFSNSISK